MNQCVSYMCDKPAWSRNLCTAHYGRHWRQGTLESFPRKREWTAPSVSFVNPLVCTCPDTLADPRINWGQCPTCKRKPLSLMASHGTPNTP